MYSGTSTAPSASTAKSVTGHSQRFSLSSATRSPLPTPHHDRIMARARTRPYIPTDVIGFQAPSLSCHRHTTFSPRPLTFRNASFTVATCHIPSPASAHLRDRFIYRCALPHPSPRTNLPQQETPGQATLMNVRRDCQLTVRLSRSGDSGRLQRSGYAPSLHPAETSGWPAQPQTASCESETGTLQRKTNNAGAPYHAWNPNA